MSQAAILKKFVRRAMNGIDDLPPQERADLHEAAAIVLARCDRNASQIAREAASLLRQAEQRQETFFNLL